MIVPDYHSLRPQLEQLLRGCIGFPGGLLHRKTILATLPQSFSRLSHHTCRTLAVHSDIELFSV